MIVVDGRTDAEKLRELLSAGAEETHLDFKGTLDLSSGSSKDAVEFVKDAIAMGNLAEGGYLVVGVDDQGRPAHSQSPIDVTQFDSAKLRDRIAKYVEAQVQPVAQPHEVEGRAVVLVFVPPNPDGLPVPISKTAQYAKSDGKMETVFSEGEVLIREGSVNVRLRYAHWPGLLARYREQVKEEARADADALIHRVVTALNENAGNGVAVNVPLDVEMDDDTLVDALVAVFEAPQTVRVRRFLNDAAERAKAGGTQERDVRLHALDRLAIVACQAVLYDRGDIYEMTVDTLERVYGARGLPLDSVRLSGSAVEMAQHHLDGLLRVFAIGALVVRQERWGYLRTLSNRVVQESTNYVYASWLRHGSVQAARAGLLQGDDGRLVGGQVISLARALVVARPALRPDYGADTSLPAADALTSDDWLLNSLCQWDLWWCLLAHTSKPGSGGAVFYPSCAAFNQYRSQSTLTLAATQPTVRRSAFGEGVTDADIADAMQEVVRTSVTQSHQHGGWWDGLRLDPAVESFVQSHHTT